MMQKSGLKGMKVVGVCSIFFLLLIPVMATAIMPVLPPGTESYATQDNQSGYAPGYILVKTSTNSANVETVDLTLAHASIHADIEKDYSTLGFSGLQLISLPENMSVQDAVSYYKTIPGVTYAEPDYFRSSDVIPDDPEFWRQWGLYNTGQIYKENSGPGVAGADINAPYAWNITTGSDTVVAVLDSGVDYLHTDLKGNIWTNQAEGTHGYDAITGTLDPMDLASHGTHCAGIIGATGNNNIGISGVNWNATILPVRFLNSFGTGTVSDEIESILWAARNGAGIYSCSFGGTNPSQAERDVIAGTDGLFICAAGNNGLDDDRSPHYPSGYDLDNIISVTATNARDELSSFSNYGKISVDIGAPGEDIYSTKHNLYTAEPLWRDSFDNLSNWSLHGNWTLNGEFYTSAPTSAQGTVNNTGTVTEPPVILTLKQPLQISNLTTPIISYDLQLVGANYTFSIQGSQDNLTWTTLEYDKKSFVIMPFSHHECKITSDLTDGSLYIRFIADGTFVTCFLDDVTLSNGYGTIAETRYGYMSGTSMATPFVSGVSAYLKASAPEASYSKIKEAILATTDPLPDLNNKTVSGGRVNMTAALSYIKNPDQDSVKLYQGWNHISVAKKLMNGNNTAFDLFGKVTNTSGHSVLKYQNNSWITVLGNETISPLSSYWIWTGNTQTITPITDITQNGTYTKDLFAGWNGFGVYGTGILPAKDQLTQVGENWTYIVGYDASSQQYQEPIIRNGTGNQSDSRTLIPYQGYWLYVTDNVTYQVTI